MLAPSSRPLALTDSEMTAVMSAARQLAPRERDGFLRRIAEIISMLPERGDGAVARAIRSVWREYYDAPDLDERAHPDNAD
jgi:hypothetical protein